MAWRRESQEMALNSLKPKYRDQDGFLMPMGFPAEHFQSALKYKPAESDVFITTYPKCGTTWMQYILYLLRNKGEPLPKGEKILHHVPHLEESGAEVVAALEEPRVIKTHLPKEMSPWNTNAKYIYVARNPKDCCTSMFHHTRNFGVHYDFVDGPFWAFFECFVRGEVDFNCFFDNLNSWFAVKDLPNLLFLTYEEMKEDTAAVVRRLGEFLGGEFEKYALDEAIVQKVVQNSSLTSMKKSPENWTFSKNDEFVRKGIIGDWRTTLSEMQSRRLDDRFREKCAGSEALHLWKSYGIPGEIIEVED